MDQKQADETDEREIVLVRDFDASPAQVFEAWSSPKKIGQWWGPNGFTTTTHRMEFKPGGEWKYIMHGPDGTDFDNYVKYRAIEKPKKIIYDHGETPGEPFHFTVQVTFEKIGNRTRLKHRMIFPSKAARDKTVNYGAIEGGKQTMNRLAEFLERR